MAYHRAVLLRGARQLITLRGPSEPRRGPALRELNIIPDGAVLIRNGVVVEVGPARRIENLAITRNAREIDANGRVVCPGFVDSHTHLICGPPRLADYEMRLAGSTYEEIAKAGGGILQSVRAIRKTPARALVHQGAETLGGFIRHGTTTVEAKSGYGLDEANEKKILKAIAETGGTRVDLVATYLGAHVTPPEWAGRADQYIDWIITEAMPCIQKLGLAEFADIYCERGAFSLAQARRYLNAATKCGLRLKIHAEQFSRLGGARLAAELGATSADHLEYISDDDVRTLAASGTIATLLPGAVLHLGLSRYAPARALIDAGAAVALATDFNPGTSPSCSMPMMLSLACAQMRLLPAEAIAAATINGAWACGRADRCGSIEVGKNADLVVFNASDYREIPYYFGVNPVAMTIKRGTIVYDARRGYVAKPD
ncbi:MAG TPA: imidazolonepropionase [Bryobacteraceae bacterium]|nr:imidazolonepropionase [Bryobacteraceae bacterium]